MTRHTSIRGASSPRQTLIVRHVEITTLARILQSEDRRVPYRGTHCMERASRGCFGFAADQQINLQSRGAPASGRRRRSSQGSAAGVVRQLRFLIASSQRSFRQPASPPQRRRVIRRRRRRRATGMMPSQAVSPMFLGGLFTPATRAARQCPGNR